MDLAASRIRGPGPWLVGLFLLAATFVAYQPVLENEFVEYDDRTFILNSPHVTLGLRADGVAWAFTTLKPDYWIPLTRLSWMLDAELFGLNASAFHATSLVLHAAGTLLLFAAFRRLSGDLWASAFVAAIFALHPIHVESVAWASARRDPLSGVFFALALLAYERRARSQRPWPWAALVAAAVGLGFMAKPTMITLPFVLLLLDVWPLRRWSPGDGLAALFGLVREKTVLFLLVLAACVVTFAAQVSGAAIASGETVPFVLRTVNSVLGYVDYIHRAFWPADLAVLYPINRTIGLNRIIVSVLGLLLVSVLALRGLRSRPFYFVGWFWYVGMLIPMIGLVQVGIHASADRYTYLPLTGLSVMVAFGAKDLVGLLPPSSQRPMRRILLGLGIGVCVLLSAATRQQVAYWKDTVTLFERTVAVTIDNGYMLHSLGVEYRERGDLARAAETLQASVRASPNYAEARRSLAVSLMELGRPGEAVEHLRRLTELEPGSAEAHRLLGDALHARGDRIAALTHYRRALELDPDDWVARKRLQEAGSQSRRDARRSGRRRRVAE
jgi:hypothetical protein